MTPFRFFGKFIFLFFVIQVIAPLMTIGQECSFEVFSDEFNYEGEPDPDHWNYETGAGGWGNNERQNYTDERDNSYVSDGTLKIHAKKSETGAWTSARLVTSGKASWLYGRFEIRAKLPRGVGTWPAIWMMPQESVYGTWPKSGEIDIMEHVGYDPGIIHGSIHTEAFNHKDNTQKGGSIEVSDAQDEFHVYSIEWTPDEIKWFVDEEEYFSFSNRNTSYKEWPFDQPFFLILNIAIGGDWGGVEGVDSDLEEAVMEIDYVRVYQDFISDFSVEGPDVAGEGEEVSFSVPSLDNVEYHWEIPSDAQVLSGENSSEITIEWGSSSGTIGCRIVSECEEKEGDVREVRLVKSPQEAPFVLSPLNEENQPLWQVPEQDEGNQFALESTSKGNLKVDYSVSSPQSNPYIRLPLSFLGDFSEFRSVRIPVKVLGGDAPGLLRLDLVDRKGRVNTYDLFKIDDIVSNKHFHIYGHTFSGSISQWDMEQIEEVRLYVNYGGSGRAGEGTFVLGDIRLAPDDYFEDPLTPENDKFEVSTETGSGGWQVNEPVAGEIGLSGGEKLQISYSELAPSSENYIQLNFDQPIDLHDYAKLNFAFSPEGEWPGEIKAAVIDGSGVFNEEDLFTIEDFSFSDEQNTLSYTYGDVEDGGEFLPCRVEALRIWLDKDAEVNHEVDFSIDSIWFSEYNPWNSIFRPKKYLNFKIWPNPAKNSLYFEDLSSDVKSYQIYSMEGRIVTQGTIDYKNTIDVSNLHNGLFVLILRTNNNQVYRGKFQIRK
ncbi:MAG: family 16 glycosylhydrolase [Bacteroidota bacterium]